MLAISGALNKRSDQITECHVETFGTYAIQIAVQ